MTGFSVSRFGGAGGGAPVSNPGVAYVQTNGNDTTAELGNPAKPFATARAAFTAVKAALNSTALVHSLVFGRGQFTLVLTNAEATGGYKFFFSGVGAASEGVTPATLLTITSIPTEGTGGMGIISIFSDYSLLIEGQFRGASGADGDESNAGGDGGVMNFRSRFSAFGTVEVGGGTGGADNGAGAGVDGATIVDIQNINVVNDAFFTLENGPCNVVNGTFYP